MASERGATFLYYDMEDKELLEKFDIYQKVFLETFKPPEWLMEAEYPFKWLMSLDGRSFINFKIDEKLKDYQNQGPDYGFEKICYLLALLFLKFVKTNFGKALKEKFWLSDDSSSSEEQSDSEHFKTEESDDLSNSEEMSISNKSDVKYSPENIYILCREVLDEMANHEGNVMHMRIGAALEHVLAATRAHMLYWQEDIDSSKEIVKNLQPISQMTIENQAGIEGIKGKFILSCYKDVRKALEPSLKAKEMDPTFAFWYYQSGKIIRNLRREYKEDMVKEEMEFFKKAVELERNPKYLVFLAQAYLEKAFFISKSNRESVAVNGMEKIAAELYRECWSLQKDSTTICRRIGNGMMKLKGQYQDAELAKQALQKSIEIHGNEVTIHQMGLLYYNIFKDDEKALECFQKVKGIYGTASEINLRLIKDPSYDPVDLIEYWVIDSITASKKDILLCEIGWYYLFLKNNLTVSVKYIWKVLKNNFSSFRVLEFTSFAFCVREPVNMLEVLVNEILLMKEKKIPLGETEDMPFLEAFLQKVYEKHSYLLEIKLNPNLKQSIKNNVDRNINFHRKKRYGYTTNKTVRESEGSWRRPESQPEENVDDKFNMNRRKMEKQDCDGVYNRFGSGCKNMKDQQPGTANYRPESRKYERGSMHGKLNRYDFKQPEGFNRSFEAHRFNASYQESKERRESHRRQSTNNNRYDVTITDWRNEMKNQSNQS